MARRVVVEGPWGRRGSSWAHCVVVRRRADPGFPRKRHCLSWILRFVALFSTEVPLDPRDRVFPHVEIVLSQHERPNHSRINECSLASFCFLGITSKGNNKFKGRWPVPLMTPVRTRRAEYNLNYSILKSNATSEDKTIPSSACVIRNVALPGLRNTTGKRGPYRTEDWQGRMACECRNNRCSISPFTASSHHRPNTKHSAK